MHVAAFRLRKNLFVFRLVVLSSSSSIRNPNPELDPVERKLVV